MSNTTAAIFRRLSTLERQVQKLKIQAYFQLPKNKQILSLYPQDKIDKALKSTRKDIWQKKYAKKIYRVS